MKGTFLIYLPVTFALCNASAFLAILLIIVSCKSGVVYDDYPEACERGDSVSRAGKTYDDSGGSHHQISGTKGVFWVRQRIKILENPATTAGIQVHAFGAFQAYWDGVLIGTNGALPTRNSAEIPGTEATCYSLPDSLSKLGIHVLALRTSQSFLTNEQRAMYAKMDLYKIY